MNLKSHVTFYALLACLMYSSTSFAATYYVSPSGKNGNNGTSTGSPWQTIQNAANKVKAGDTVYIMKGTYREQVTISAKGNDKEPIVFRSQDVNNPPLIVGTATGKDIVTVSGNFITLDNLRFSLSSPCKDDKDNDADQFDVIVSGNNVTVRNCLFTNTEDAAKEYACNARETGISIVGGDNANIINNTFSNLTFNGIKIQDGGGDGLTSNWRIEGNTMSNLIANGVSSESSKSRLQGGLISGNYIYGSLTSDGIQTNGNYNDTSTPANWGIVIRNNRIGAVNQENCIDLKGARYILIENNICWGSSGNNNGSLAGDPNDANGGAAIMSGLRQTAQDIIVRGNIIYDNHGGINPRENWRVYHNTVINNDRNYTGANSAQTSSGLFDRTSGLEFYHSGRNVKSINNIFGGHAGIEITVTGDIASIYLNGNFYASDFGTPRWGTFINNSETSYNNLNAWKSALAKISIQGKEVNSLVGVANFINVPSNVSGNSSKFNFDLNSNSAARGKAIGLTTTTNAGSNSKSLTVADSAFFATGFGARGITGDHIKIGSTVAQISSISGKTITLMANATWSNKVPVFWCPNHVCPAGALDVGARQYSGAAPTVKTANLTSQTSESSIPTLQSLPGNASATEPTALSKEGKRVLPNFLKRSNLTIEDNQSHGPTTVAHKTQNKTESLLNAKTYAGDSGNLSPDFPAKGTWDGCTNSEARQCAAGAENAADIYIDFDLGGIYDLTSAKIFGNAIGNAISANWSLYYRINPTDEWTEAFSEKDCFGNQWYTENLNGTVARYVRFEVKGSNFPAVLIPEIQLFGTL